MIVQTTKRHRRRNPRCAAIKPNGQPCPHAGSIINPAGQLVCKKHPK